MDLPVFLEGSAGCEDGYQRCDKGCDDEREADVDLDAVAAAEAFLYRPVYQYGSLAG